MGTWRPIYVLRVAAPGRPAGPYGHPLGGQRLFGAVILKGDTMTIGRPKGGQMRGEMPSGIPDFGLSPRPGNALGSAHMQRARERGATAVEYGLFVALIAAVIIVGVTALGQSTIGLFQPVIRLLRQPPALRIGRPCTGTRTAGRAGLRRSPSVQTAGSSSFPAALRGLADKVHYDNRERRTLPQDCSRSPLPPPEHADEPFDRSLLALDEPRPRRRRALHLRMLRRPVPWTRTKASPTWWPATPSSPACFANETVDHDWTPVSEPVPARPLGTTRPFMPVWG